MSIGENLRMLVNVNELNLGQIVAADILNANDAVIIEKGAIVDEKKLRRLKMWGIKEVEISDGSGIKKDPVLEQKESGSKVKVNKIMDKILSVSEVIKSERIFIFEK